MGISPSDFEAQREMLGDRIGAGLDLLDEYGRPMIDRYGRTALVAGVVVVAMVGVALLVARSRRRRTLGDRIVSASSRLEGPISSIRAAAGRISR
jgi:hypothetical protein